MEKLINIDFHIHSLLSVYKKEPNCVSNSDVLLKKLNKENINILLR